jgi:hypothetical protein
MNTVNVDVFYYSDLVFYIYGYLFPALPIPFGFPEDLLLMIGAIVPLRDRRKRATLGSP